VADPKVVGPDLDGALVDAAVRGLFSLSWNRARELIRRGKIAVDGRVVTSATVRVRSGASIEMNLAARDPKLERQALDASALVFVDANVVVVDKPAGIATVPFDPEGMGASIAIRARPGEDATLDQRVRTALAKREKARGRSGPPPEIGVVHRLDKETSGLLVFTRSWAAKKALMQDFRAHTVHRRYVALVHGVPRSGRIETHLIEDRGDGLRGSVEHRRGRNKAIGTEKTQRAVTHVEVLEQFESAALVGIALETGRTHQIRIHLSEEGNPLVGERVYIRGWKGEPIPAPRVMLHAAELGFVHPMTQEEMRWTAPPPEDFEEMLAFLRGSGAAARQKPSAEPTKDSAPKRKQDDDRAPKRRR
jgi:23S rRNA pseudouridine1911/1915/1917 synthase